MTRIVVTTAYRPKRPRKRKAVAIAGPAIVRKRGRAAAVVPPDRGGKPTPANDDRKPAIATSISRKRARLQRAEPAAEPESDDPEADAAMRAWLERAKWGRGPAR